MMHRADIFPSVSEVDFSAGADISGYAYLLSTIAARCSREDNPGYASMMHRKIKTASMEWLANVEENITSLSAGDALSVTESYDTVCGLVYGSGADHKFVSENRLKAFEARIHGDETINQYELQQAVTREIDRHNPKFFGYPLQWKSVRLDRWHKQFRHGMCLTHESDYDILQRVSCLLSNDLWAFETRNESRFKQLLFENHRHYLDSMLDPIQNAGSMHNAQCIMHNDRSMLDQMYNAECTMHNESQNDGSDYELCIMNYELTKALSSLLISSTPYLTQEEYTTYDTRIRSALIASKQTNRYHREALRLSSL